MKQKVKVLEINYMIWAYSKKKLSVDNNKNKLHD